MEKITLVTVCYNAEKEIEGTMRSVCEQDYPFIEYLIIDGASTDRTLQIAQRIKDDYFQKPNIDIVIRSEKDNGIYDAMNKAIDMATGDWILFINAGDFLYANDTVSRLFSEGISKDVDGVYGDTERFSGDWKQVYPGNPLENIATGIPLPFCHQSVFVRTEHLKAIKFDTNYKLAGDYNFFTQCYLRHLYFIHKEVIVSKYAMGGVSETRTVKHLQEKIEIREKNGIEKYSVVKKKYMVYRLKARQDIKKFLPKSMLKLIRGY